MTEDHAKPIGAEVPLGHPEATPAPVLRRLMADPRLAVTARLDTVVATIDAVSGLNNLDRQPVAARQCAVADRRVIRSDRLFLRTRNRPDP